MIDNDYSEVRESFEANKFVVLKDIFSKDLLTYLSNASLCALTAENYFYEESEKTLVVPDDGVNKALGTNSSILADALLVQLTPLYQQITGKNLAPTYAYHRNYYQGDELLKHYDNDHCQYSVTIQVSKNSKPWSIYFQDIKKPDTDVVKIVSDVGDVVFYKGEELYHWRDPSEQDLSIHFFLHYVDRDDDERSNNIYFGDKGIVTRPKYKKKSTNTELQKEKKKLFLPFE